MKKLIACALSLISLYALGQDSTKGNPVEIFSSQKVINANTTHLIPRGKMEFHVTHLFGDIGGPFGKFKNFFGLDNVVDDRIGFTVGLTNHLQATLARAKGASRQTQLYEIGLKAKLMEQREGKGHPVAVAFFTNIVIAANPARFPDREDSYQDFGDRVSNTFQLIMARRFGRVSVQLNPTVVTRGLALSYDKKSFFALGGALRIPAGRRFNLVMDYFHTFRDQASKDSFSLNNRIAFYDALGVGVEILTARHIFRLNFTNTSETLENRFIPRTITAWSRGQWRWGFTLAREFTLWKPKK